MGLDVLGCPKCQNRLRRIADFTDQEVINKIIKHLRLPLAAEVLSGGAFV